MEGTRGCRLHQQPAVSNVRVHVHLSVISESVLGVDLPGGPFQLEPQICLKRASGICRSVEA